MNSEVSRKIRDAMSLLHLLEAVSNRFSEYEYSVDASRESQELIPWSGIAVTLVNAKRMLEEVYSSVTEVNDENTYSSRYEFTPPASLASRVRSVPTESSSINGSFNFPKGLASGSDNKRSGFIASASESVTSIDAISDSFGIREIGSQSEVS